MINNTHNSMIKGTIIGLLECGQDQTRTSARIQATLITAGFARDEVIVALDSLQSSGLVEYSFRVFPTNGTLDARVYIYVKLIGGAV